MMLLSMFWPVLFINIKSSNYANETNFNSFNPINSLNQIKSGKSVKFGQKLNKVLQIY